MAQRWQCSLYRGLRAQRQQRCSPATTCSAARRGRTPRCSVASGRPWRPWGASSALAGPRARENDRDDLAGSHAGGRGRRSLRATAGWAWAYRRRWRRVRRPGSLRGYGALAGRAAGGGGQPGPGAASRDVRGSSNVMAVDERLDRCASKAQLERMTYALDERAEDPVALSRLSSGGTSRRGPPVRSSIAVRAAGYVVKPGHDRRAR